MKLPDLALLDLPGGPLAYRRGGEGPPLLLIHGWGGSSRYWLGAFAALADAYDVIALDLPGFGGSPPPAGPATLAGAGDAVCAAIEALGLERVTLGGHSFGASVALLAADRRPERVARLALVSFGLPRSPEEEALFAGLHLQLRAGAALWSPWLALWSPWLAAARPWTHAVWTTPPLPALLASRAVHSVAEVPAAALALGAADLVAMDARVAVELASSTGDPTVAAVARRVAAPTLVIGGRDDQLFPPSAGAALAAAMPRAGLVLIDHCGHVPMAERPAQFYAALGAFLAL
ncbi:MAG TPA: alpha/beta hydrolase [Chloroflexaceae bacterium]|nr:alpha/beta hydrolase [Chloroflexaceae bacterium]